MARSHAERKAGWKWTAAIFAIVLLATFSYAVVRYSVFSGVSVENIPLFIFNKALAFAAVILIGLSFIIGPLAHWWPARFEQKLYLRKYMGVGGFGLAALHSLISLLLFSPAYYPRFFAEGGRLTFSGELSMLFGALALFIFSAVSITSLPPIEKGMHPRQWLFVQRLGYLAFILVLFHVAVMGLPGWTNPAGWPGGLLPISLLSALVIIAVLLVRALAIPTYRRS